jgi:3-deoxy-7-phosphoheptulonate synthase
MPIPYPDPAALSAAVSRLRTLPPLVTSFEVEALKALLAEAQDGRRFLLQGGDCAESLSDCRPDAIAAQLKVLLQMSLVLTHAAELPVIRVGRFAGQYAKPRSSLTERRWVDGVEVELPSYFGDLVNHPAFTAASRQPDPQLLLDGYAHAALTLNFIRSLTEGGFADAHHPEYWDLSFLARAELSPTLRAEYQALVAQVSRALRFMEALGERRVEQISRARFYTSHEGLNLHYESAQTRQVPRRSAWYDLTTHLPWIGERTRQRHGAHVEFFRGVANPIGVKVGPSLAVEDWLRLAEALNPQNEPGKLLAITRLGAGKVEALLPPLVRASQREGLRVLWVADPMHGNTQTTRLGVKTRRFEDVLGELETSFVVHAAEGGRLGGVHLELTGEDVTECVGGGLVEADLERNYASLCDPRLNYGQALEIAFRAAHHLRPGPTPPAGVEPPTGAKRA